MMTLQCAGFKKSGLFPIVKDWYESWA